MPEQRTAHQRTHSLLLLQRLLSLRQGVSPLTLLLDSLEQSSKPIVTEFIEKAKTARTSTIYISYETLRPPQHINHFIQAHKKTLTQLLAEVRPLLSTNNAALIILDTIHPILSRQTSDLPLAGFLTSLLPSPQICLLATYHTSIPVPFSIQHESPYAPAPLSLLSYLATTLITISPLHHVLAEKRAVERAHAPPLFGLDAAVEGVLLGPGGNGAAAASDGGRSIVLRIEHRRKSGRSVGVNAVLDPDALPAARMGLLEEHPLYVSRQETSDAAGEVDELASTFSLALTDKQRRDREGVVLPYLDAQRDGDSGEGGRILYQMGEEDFGDWDEEEDEI